MVTRRLQAWKPQSESALVRALQISAKLVVRGRVELPTFRFSGRATYGILASCRSEFSRRASSSLLDCLGRIRRVKAKPHAVASRALTRRPPPEGWQLSRRTRKDQGTAISADRTAVRRAISGPLTPVTSGLSRLSHGLTGRCGTMASLPDPGRTLTCEYGLRRTGRTLSIDLRISPWYRWRGAVPA